MTVLFFDNQFNSLFEGVLISMTSEGATRLTDHPVERGADIQDHAQPMSETCRLAIGISDTPLNGVASPGATALAIDVLEQLRRNPQVISVVTSRRTFPEVIITNISAPYNDMTGNGTTVDVVVKEVRLTQTTTTTVPASILAALRRSSGKTKDKVQDNTRQASGKEEAAKDVGLAKGLFTALGGLFK